MSTATLDPWKLRLDLSPRMVAADARHVTLLMEVVDQVPPVLVRRTTRQVVDGVHRTLAARRAGKLAIRVQYFDGDDAEAFIEAVHSNVRHGKPLTRAERTAAATRILTTHADWSDRRVAEVCGLGRRAIAELRRRSTDPSRQLNSRVGIDGRRRSADPAAARDAIARRLRSDAPIGVRELAGIVGVSPATVMDVRDRLARGEDPIPPRLRGPSPPAAWTTDAALAAHGANELGVWLERSAVADDDWAGFVDAIPLSRVYEVADEARARARSWKSFAEMLEARARLEGTA